MCYQLAALEHEAPNQPADNLMHIVRLPLPPDADNRVDVDNRRGREEIRRPNQSAHPRGMRSVRQTVLITYHQRTVQIITLRTRTPRFLIRSTVPTRCGVSKVPIGLEAAEFVRAVWYHHMCVDSWRERQCVQQFGPARTQYFKEKAHHRFPVRFRLVGTSCWHLLMVP